MEEILDYAHDSEAPILKYNDENSLACLISLIYLNARSKYHIEREHASGKGYADFIFYPLREGETSIILELKKDKGARKAIDQILEKRYYSKLKHSKGKILAVGISYNNDKNYECIVEDITNLK